ncbi:MAG: hypothetical protein JXB35_10425 [Anaerolineae bacterium]|nr:hypothetical protein [Anaerolineae bacterium]
MTYNGRLDQRVLRCGTDSVVGERFALIEVWRGESLVTRFRGRHAGVSRSASFRESVQGLAGEVHEVFVAPRGADVRTEDELWLGERRYRVVLVDPQPGGALQVLVQNLQ